MTALLAVFVSSSVLLLILTVAMAAVYATSGEPEGDDVEGRPLHVAAVMVWFTLFAISMGCVLSILDVYS